MWRVLGINPPSFQDCLGVIRELATNRRPLSEAESLVLLETLRELARSISPATSTPHLRRLPLYTSKGWISRRPVYVIDDPQLVDVLAEFVAVWMPGADLAQFRALLSPLGISELTSSEATVINQHQAELADEGTETFQAAVRILQADLAHNDTDAEASAIVDWESLEQFEVRVLPSLQIQMDGTHLPDAPIIDVNAQVASRGVV
jgi:hypothetical protein